MLFLQAKSHRALGKGFARYSPEIQTDFCVKTDHRKISLGPPNLYYLKIHQGDLTTRRVTSKNKPLPNIISLETKHTTNTDLVTKSIVRVPSPRHEQFGARKKAWFSFLYENHIFKNFHQIAPKTVTKDQHTLNRVKTSPTPKQGKIGLGSNLNLSLKTIKTTHF